MTDLYQFPRPDMKTKFIKSSNFGQVFGLFFVVIFTQGKEIVSFHCILLKFTPNNKIYRKTFIWRSIFQLPY